MYSIANFGVGIVCCGQRMFRVGDYLTLPPNLASPTINIYFSGSYGANILGTLTKQVLSSETLKSIASRDSAYQ